MKEVIFIILGIIAVFAAMYGIYWVAKTMSYVIFYEDMVQQTVREMVKPEFLNMLK